MMINWLVFLVIVVFFMMVVLLSSRSNPLTSRAGFNLNARQNLVSILGDSGMLDPGARVLLYMPNTGQRHADCIENVSPNGPGPGGNLITEADNARTDWPDSELNLANKCAKPAAGSSSLNWYHWSAELGNAGNSDTRTTVNHEWSRKDTLGQYITGFSGEWLPSRGAFNNARYSLTISTEDFGGKARRTWTGSLATGTVDFNNLVFFAPSATDYRQILYNRWLEGSRVIFESWVRLTESFPEDRGSGYRFAAPELEGCWKLDGSACTDSPNDVARFLSFDLNPNRIDNCTVSAIDNCPPYHVTSGGEKISKTDQARFPYDAYYYWCGSKFEPGLSAAEQCFDYGSKTQEIFQLAPHSTWARFGAPTSPLRVNEDTFLRMDVGAVAHHIYSSTQNYPEVLRFNKIYVGPEMFSPNVTVTWKVAGFDVLKPAEPVPPQSDTVPPSITEMRAIGITGNQAVVVWATDEMTTGAVQYQIVDTKGQLLTKIDSKSALRHSVVLGNLSPNTVYTYSIVASDTAGNRTTSNPLTFTTGRVGNPNSGVK